MAYKSIGEKELRTDYPFTTGLTLTAKHEGRQINLVARDGSNVQRSLRKGID